MRGLLSGEPPPSWGRLEIIDAVLDYIRADPCNHPDASTARATRTTSDGVSQILQERGWGQTGRASDSQSDRTQVWLVEVKGEIPTLGIRGVSECDSPPTGRSVVFTMVTLDGKVTTQWGIADR